MACVVEDFAGAAAVDPADFEQIAAQVPALTVALERAFRYEPDHLDLVDGARTVQVRLTRNAAEATSDTPRRSRRCRMRPWRSPWRP